MNFKLLIGLSSLLTAVLAVPAVPAELEVPEAFSTREVEDELQFSVYSHHNCPSSDKSIPIAVSCGQVQDILGYETGTRSLKIDAYGGKYDKLKAIQACFSNDISMSNPKCKTANRVPQNCLAVPDNMAYVKFVCIPH